MKQYLFFTLLCVVSSSSCVEISNKFTSLPPGVWRATLELDNTPFVAVVEEEVSTNYDIGDVLPFLFELKYKEDNTFYIEIINGPERIVVDDIRYGRDKATAKDTVWIDFPVYDSYIKAIYEENILEGSWHVNYRDNYQIPFKAYFGQDYLFSTDVEEAKTDITGRWAAIFEIGLETEYPAIGEFKQSGNDLYGTFLTEIGDYRYLSGQILNDKFYLSTFDGAHAFLFQGKIIDQNNVVGTFRSGKHHTAGWKAERDSEAALPDPYSLTRMVGEGEAFNFTFANTEGRQISLDDPYLQGKIKIVQIMGTWCPNCKDETHFLKEYLEKENPDDVEIIAVAFEKYREADKAFEILRKFKVNWQIPYEVVLGGYYDKGEASMVFPMLNEIISYPTLIFLDQDNKVRKIHTGFTGPATNEYDDFKSEFYDIINQLRTDI